MEVYEYLSALPQKLSVHVSWDVFAPREDVNLLDIFLWTVSSDIIKNLHQEKVNSS